MVKLMIALGSAFGLLVGFGIKVLGSWLAMRDRNKRLSHYIENLRGS
jgi:hypothetical protein